MLLACTLRLRLMNAVTLPRDFEVWAEAEVAAGRAASVEEVAARALQHYRREQQAAQLRYSLDEAVAESDRVGWLDLHTVFGDLKAKFLDR